MGYFMERKSKLRGAMEQVKSDVQGVTEDAKETVEELRATVREAVPRPLRRRFQKRVDSLISRRRRKPR